MAENRTDMMKFKGVSAAIVVGLSVVSLCESAFSLGFGRPTSRAVLGETLSLTVPLHLEAGEVIADECVAADVYFGDDKQTSLSVKATVLPGEGSQRAVRVVTTSLINEPVVTVYLGAGCKAKITRKFVAFADPPGLAIGADSPMAANARGPVVGDGSPLAAAPSGAVDERAASSTRAARTSGTTPRPAKVPSARKPRDAASNGVITEGPATSLASATAPLKVSPDRRSSTPAKAAVNEPPKRESSRLVLDPAEADALVIPNLMMTSAMSGIAADIDAPEVKARRAAAAALWTAMNSSPEQLARDRQRMQELEQRLAHLQQESTGAQSRVAAMEARVREAEDQRLRHPLVYALVALVVLLAAAVAWLAMRRRSQPAEAAQSWWQGEPGDGGGAPQGDGAHAAEPAPSMAEPSLARTSAEFMPVRPAATAPSAPLADTAAPVAAAAASVAAPAMANESTTSSRAMLIKPAAQEAREITVEELIDLEQQAEFFVVLGQDDAAIELLEGHVQSTAGASPLPHLKLLEIYQRLDRRDDYERVREAFNGRFNAYAPSWESDLQHGHALEDYPGVIDRLQNLWSVPAKAMDVLEVSLTRADGSAETFDLPAYRELLFLYGVARDLSEREAQDRTPVDLLLPVQAGGADDADDISPPTMLQPLMATRPVKALPEVTPSLSLDLSLDDPAPVDDDGGARVDMDDADKDKPQGGTGNSIDFEHVDLPQNNKG